MSSKRILSCDVDLCVCPSDLGWYSWLCDRQKGPQQLCKPSPRLGFHKPGMKFPYNLGDMFETVEDPYLYWRELDYSQFEPIKGSAQALEKLSKYFDIVFISAHKGTHGKSKYYWLQKHFPFKTGVMLTKEKYLMNNSVVAHIDDRKSMLRGFDFEKRILFNTPYEQEVECETALSFDRWNDEIVKKICEEYL